MTLLRDPYSAADDGGALFHRTEGVDHNGVIGDGPSGCPSCGWSGSPMRLNGARSNLCPFCQVPETHDETGDQELRACAPEDVFGRGPWARLAQGDLWRPGAVVIPFPTRKVGRNEPCPCESGRKFKKCCGAAA